MNHLTLLLCVLISSCISLRLHANNQADYANKALDMYKHVVEMRTAAGHGQVPKMAQYLADQLISGGFDKNDIHLIPVGETAALVVRYHGDGSAHKKPISINAHMDVVEAFAKDWQNDPFTLLQKDGFFLGRGTVDDKLGVIATTSAFLRLKAEGFMPNRDIILAFTGDEESSMASTKALVTEYRELIDSEFMLNADAGGATLPEVGGRPASFDMQAAEKTYATFELRLTNKGGHSSRPRPNDNAIYDLSEALVRLSHYQFPVRQNELTQRYFAGTAKNTSGVLGQAMADFAKDPSNQHALDILRRESSYVGTTGTTCVATMLKAGHAENALPQSAVATVNCRIFPGEGVKATQAILKKVIANNNIELHIMDEVTETDASPIKAEIIAALQKAVDSAYPGLEIVPYMSSGATDGMHFRAAGIPSYGVHGEYIKASDLFSHGLNERLPVDSFYKALNHWYILIKEIAHQTEFVNSANP